MENNQAVKINPIINNDINRLNLQLKYKNWQIGLRKTDIPLHAVIRDIPKT